MVDRNMRTFPLRDKVAPVVWRSGHNDRTIATDGCVD
jgi:hypothetical protein